jgi:hypothetical protein
MFGKGLASMLLSNRPKNDESPENLPKPFEDTKSGFEENQMEKKSSVIEKDIIFSSQSEKTENVSGKVQVSSESIEIDKSPIGVDLGSEVVETKGKPEEPKVVKHSGFLALLDNEIQNNASQTEKKFAVFTPSQIDIRPSYRESIGSLDLERQAFGVSVSPLRSLDLQIGPTVSDQIYPSRTSVNIEIPCINDHDSLRKLFVKNFSMAEPSTTSMSEPFHPIIVPKDLIITGNSKRPLSPRIENNKLKLKGFEVTDLIKPFELEIENAYPKLANGNPFSFVSIGAEEDNRLKSLTSSAMFETSRKLQSDMSPVKKSEDDSNNIKFSDSEIIKSNEKSSEKLSQDQGISDGKSSKHSEKEKYQIGEKSFEDLRSFHSDSEEDSQKKQGEIKLRKKNKKALRSGMKKTENFSRDSESDQEENESDQEENERRDHLFESSEIPKQEKSESSSYIEEMPIGFGLGLIHDSVLDKYYEESEARNSELESSDRLFSKRSSKISTKNDLFGFNNEKGSSLTSEVSKKLNLDQSEAKFESQEIQISSFPIPDYSSSYQIAEAPSKDSAKFGSLSKKSRKNLCSSKKQEKIEDPEIPKESEEINDFFIESKEIQLSENPLVQTIEDIEVENVIFTLPEDMKIEENLESGTFSKDRHHKKESIRDKFLVSPENLMRTPELDLFSINPSFVSPESVRLPNFEVKRQSLSPEYSANVYRVGGSDDEIDYHNFRNESFESPIRADSPVFHIQSPESSIVDSARNSIPQVRVFGAPSQNQSFLARDSMNIPDIKSIVNNSGIFFKRSKLHLLRKSPRKLDPELFSKNVQGRLTAEEELSRVERD